MMTLFVLQSAFAKAVFYVRRITAAVEHWLTLTAHMHFRVDGRQVESNAITASTTLSCVGLPGPAFLQSRSRIS